MEDDGLITTRVPRALEMKSKLFGFELPDLLLIFFNLAATNFIFGGTSVRYPLVWGTTITMALFLYFANKGKPDGFIQHYGEFLLKAPYLAAGKRDRFYRLFKKKECDVSKK